ncbi:NUDIX hydrolase family protein [Tieghemostelium lacteum]|uniref:m7GpppN-mRNA hydrolase NUDT17 n=1 Tax=Tieghemostelium lacteum TaxID=361077 RepID=A0A151ZH38_TIELA|nr:NUDIX hydrolase family protein [Tieghemostelium lacteum]|eukprot:KYQ93283.1 NUDIX hydrolase family protein [Tieghemostelium lacteum]
MNVQNVNEQHVKKEYWPMVFNSQIELLAWDKCVLSQLGLLSPNLMGNARVRLDKKNGRLFILNTQSGSDGEEEYYNVTLGHAPGCPFYELEKSQSPIHKDLLYNSTKSPNTKPVIKVGVSVVIQDRNDRILITRRSNQLRIFPGIWVNAGGHMEKGESFIDTGIREVLEETGIELDLSRDQLKVIGAFESGFPHHLDSNKLPTDHHMVVYLQIKLSKSSHEFHLKMDPKEVDFSTWIPLSFLYKVLHVVLPNYYNISYNYTNYIQTSQEENEELHIIYPPLYQGTKLDSNQLKNLFLMQKELISTGTIYIFKQLVIK